MMMLTRVILSWTTGSYNVKHACSSPKNNVQKTNIWSLTVLILVTAVNNLVICI